MATTAKSSSPAYSSPSKKPLGPAVILCGPLKLRGLFSTWRRCYFELSSDGVLSRYRNEKNGSPEEQIMLVNTGVQIVHAESLTDKKWSMGILLPSKSPIMLNCFSEEDYHAWYAALHKFSVKTDSKTSKRHSGSSSSDAVSSHSSSSSKTTHTKNDSIVEILEAVLDASVIANEKGYIVGFNKAAEQLFGYTKEEVLHKNVSTLMTHDYAKFHDAYIRNYYQSGKKKLIGIPRKLTAKTKAGEPIAVHVNLGEVPRPSNNLSSNLSSTVSSNLSSNSSSASEAAASNQGCFVAIFRPLDIEKESKYGATLESTKDKTLSKLSAAMSSVKDIIQESYKQIMRQYDEIEPKGALLEQNQQLIQQHIQLKYKKKNLRTDVFFLDGLSTITPPQGTDCSLLLQNTLAYEEFFAFCKMEKSEEGFVFLKEVHDFDVRYTDCRDSHLIKNAASVIYDKFLKGSAPMKINTGAPLLRTVEDKLQSTGELDHKLFDNVYKDILITLNPLFIKFFQTKRGRAMTETIIAMSI